MWPFEERRPAPPALPAMHQRIEHTMTVEEVLIARLIQAEQRIAGLEQCVVMLSQACNKLAENQNLNFLHMQKSFENLVKYVMTPRASIMPGEQRDKN